MEFQVKVIVSSLNIRSGPGTSYDTLGTVTEGNIFTIVETNSDSTWGKMQSGGWISIKDAYVKKITPTTDSDGKIYEDGVFRRNTNNNGWVSYNDNNEIFMRNKANTGWVGGAGKVDYPIINRRNSTNTGWVQIYPGGVVEENTEVVLEGETKMADYRKYWANWRKSFARQGWAIARDATGQAGGIQFGLINLQAKKVIRGCGSVLDPGTPKFGGGNGASGNYNLSQIAFFRGTKHPTWASGNPLGSHDSTGYFGYAWKSTGPRSPIPTGDLILNANNGRSAFLRWANNTNNYGSFMCIYNGETENSTAGSYSKEYSRYYLTIENFKMQLYGYKYSANRVFSDDGIIKTMVSRAVNNTRNTTHYIDVVVPEDKANLPIEKIAQGINNGTIPYVKPKDMMTYSDFDYKPCILQQNGTILVTSPIYNDYDIVQYKFEGEWHDAIALSPRNFKVLNTSTEARIMNNLTGEIYFQMLLEWE